MCVVLMSEKDLEGQVEVRGRVVGRIRRLVFQWQAVVVLVLAASVVGLLLIPEPTFDREYFERVGYPGLFLVTLMANASIILPTPGFIAVVVAGAVLNPLLVALVGALGMTIGELSGYLVGRAGSTISRGKEEGRESRWSRWTKLSNRLVGRWGVFGIFVLAALPNPLFDIAGIAAGAVRMGIAKFMVATFAGRLIRTSLLAYSSAYSVDTIIDFFD